MVVYYENVNQQYVHVKFFCRAHRTDGLQDRGVFLHNSNLHILMKDAHFPKDNINGKVLFYSFYLAESLIKKVHTGLYIKYPAAACSLNCFTQCGPIA